VVAKPASQVPMVAEAPADPMSMRVGVSRVISFANITGGLSFVVRTLREETEPPSRNV
jgi:hypothetical protein